MKRYQISKKNINIRNNNDNVIITIFWDQRRENLSQLLRLYKKCYINKVLKFYKYNWSRKKAIFKNSFVLSRKKVNYITTDLCKITIRWQQMQISTLCSKYLILYSILPSFWAYVFDNLSQNYRYLLEKIIKNKGTKLHVKIPIHC